MEARALCSGCRCSMCHRAAQRSAPNTRCMRRYFAPMLSCMGHLKALLAMLRLWDYGHAHVHMAALKGSDCACGASRVGSGSRETRAVHLHRHTRGGNAAFRCCNSSEGSVHVSTRALLESAKVTAASSACHLRKARRLTIHQLLQRRPSEFQAPRERRPCCTPSLPCAPRPSVPAAPELTSRAPLTLRPAPTACCAGMGAGWLALRPAVGPTASL